MVQWIKNAIHTLKYYYAEFNTVIRNQWKHWIVGLFVAIVGLVSMLLFPDLKINGWSIFLISSFIMIIFEVIQSNIATEVQNKFKIVDTIFDILIGVSGTVFVLYIFGV